ncbi:uncharacterized protein BCR38DRAFT_26764 [Pseudomassariella vexata]|uniref:Major facilitator superfamily domain-containing protein n=1 Tax=Pseudomassariella vexata TaxID=1141098 RepID=A0A1Y2EKK5_9PEZI|nr:uncharacterized protein BCR38DRAFT_26764 [Pseudomassariella vexata]ORY72073.1 hypothetical protein BCR38DRAFT_26764 [Pseudomassariella vexata]
MLFSDTGPEPAAATCLEDAEARTIPGPELITSDANKKEGQTLASSQSTATADIEYPSELRLDLIITMFLVSLDRMILIKAIPQITDDFGPATGTGYDNSAYLLTTCAFQLLHGEVYCFFYSTTATYLIAIFLVETGSAVSGGSPKQVEPCCRPSHCWCRRGGGY